MLPSAGFVFKFDAEHLCEVLSQAVRSGRLHTTACCRDEGFDGRGVEPSCKLLVLGFLRHTRTHNTELEQHCRWHCRLDHGTNLALEDRDTQQSLVNLGIQIQDLQDLFIGFSLRRECGMPFL